MKMLHKFADKSAKILLKNINNPNYEKEVYVYGIEIIASTLMNLLSIILLSLIVGDVKAGVIFLLFFIPLRLFAGGYHADTYGKCFVIGNVSYVIVHVLYKLSYRYLHIEWFLLLGAMCMYYIFLHAPVVNENQPISVEKQKLNRRMVRIFLIMDILVSVCMWLNNQNLLYMVVLSVCLMTVFMIITKIEKGGEENGTIIESH